MEYHQQMAAILRGDPNITVRMDDVVDLVRGGLPAPFWRHTSVLLRPLLRGCTEGALCGPRRALAGWQQDLDGP